MRYAPAVLDRKIVVGLAVALVICCVVATDCYPPGAPSAAWVNLVAAVATCAAVVVALFQDLLRAKMSPPKLVLSLRETVDIGEDVETLHRDTSFEKEWRTAVWWFHLRVESGQRRVIVHGVRVVLSRVNDDRGNRIWEGEIPMSWGVDAQQLTVGPTWLANLCALYKDRRTLHGRNQGRVLMLQPITPTPYNFPIQVKRDSPVTLVLQARGDEVDSNVLRVRIEWDGEWADDEAERRKHLTVTVVN